MSDPEKPCVCDHAASPAGFGGHVAAVYGSPDHPEAAHPAAAEQPEEPRQNTILCPKCDTLLLVHTMSDGSGAAELRGAAREERPSEKACCKDCHHSILPKDGGWWFCRTPGCCDGCTPEPAPPKVEPPAMPEAVTIGQTTLLREHLPLLACPPVPEPQTATGERPCACGVPTDPRLIHRQDGPWCAFRAVEPHPEPPEEGQPSPRLEPLWCKHSDDYELYCPACIESIRERIAALENALAGMLDKWGKHSGSCCTFDEAGKVIVTPESCKCAPPEKSARAVLAARP